MNILTRNIYLTNFKSSRLIIRAVVNTFCTDKPISSINEANSQNANDPEIFGSMKTSSEKETFTEDFGNEFLTHIQNRHKTNSSVKRGSATKKYALSKNKRQLKSKETNFESDEFGTLDPDLIKKMNIEMLPQDDEALNKKFDGLENKDKESHSAYFQQIIQKVKERRLKEALAIFEEMKRESVRPHIYVFTMLIGACGRAGYHKKAFEIFTEMRKYGYTPYPTTLTGLFNACAESPFPASALIYARRLLEKIEINKFPTNEIVYHSMVKAFGRCGDLKKAFEIVDEMVEKKMSITADTFNNLLQACISNKDAGFTHAVMVLRQMQKWRIGQNVRTYNLLLRCSRDCGIGEEEVRTQLLVNLIPPKRQDVKQQSQLFLQDDRVPSLSTTFSFLDPYLPSQPQSSDLIIGLKDAATPQNRLALFGGAEGFLRHMAQNKVRPNIKTLTLLLDCIPANLDAEAQLLTALNSGHLKPDVDFFNMLIKRRCFRGQYNEAKDVLDFLPKHGLSPNLMTYGVLAMACRSRKDFAFFLNDLKKLKIQPNIEMLGSVLHTGVHQLNFFLILDVMQAMQEQEVKPDHLVLKLLDKALTEGERQFWLQEKQLPGVRQNLVSSPSFKKGYTYFRMNYKSWLESVQMDLPQHPWEQYDLQPVDCK